MNRRLFLGLLSSAVLDPERLLWVPGRKLISIPKPIVKVDTGKFRAGRIIDLKPLPLVWIDGDVGILQTTCYGEVLYRKKGT